MKFRRDFITNSSSSSYVCEVCGNENSGYSDGIDDLGFFECQNGHIVCKDHASLSKEDREKLIAESDDENLVELLKNKNLSIDDLLSKSYGWGIHPSFCPICTMKSISRIDLNNYKNVLLNKSNKQIEEDIRKHFKNYDEFSSTLKREIKRLNNENSK